ncbi:MAG: alpha/beta hydrolase [Myxococcales bacterium]|nr:alpha/beta hydrolase [Myxococcales bacterium]
MGLLYLLQNRLIFHPESEMMEPAYFGLAGIEEVSYLAEDGLRLTSWFSPSRPNEPTIIFFHGNAGNLSHRGGRMKEAQEAGLGMLLVGYRGYGKSEGAPDEEGLYRDARAALAYLRARPEVDTRKLVYFGESLGCAVALDLAVTDPPAAIILEAPFSSMREEAAAVFPWLPTSLLLRSRFENEKKASRVRSPALVVHGRRDEVVPFELGKKVFAALAGKKRFFELDCHHNDIPEAGGNEYREAWVRFVRQNAGARDP